MSNPQTTKPSAVDEAMIHTMTMCGPLTKREQYIAKTAANSAAKWTMRVIAEKLKEESDVAKI